MSKTLLIQAAAAFGSLGGYALGKAINENAVYPLILIGGFIGALAGEGVSEIMDKNQRQAK